MKVLALLLFIVYLHDVICQETLVKPYNTLLKYPKKTKPSAKKNVQILLSRKFRSRKESVPLKTKMTVSENGYTAFPVVGISAKQIYDVPDSPYFPFNDKDDHKVRVKKVMSDYMLPSLRRKRSADISTKSKDKLHNKNTKKEAKNDKGRDNAVISKGYSNKKSQKDNKLRGKKSKKHINDQDKNPSKQRLNDAKNMKNTEKVGSKLRSKTLRKKRPAKKTKANNTKRSRKLRKGRRQSNTTNVKSVTLKDKDSRRLIAARDAVIEDYPYMVSIQKNNEHWCAGALLNPRIVITTANCVWKSNRISRLKVRAGSRHADRGGQLVHIQEVMKHPNWSIRKNPDNDVALLLLGKRIKFSDKIHGVDLPNRIMMPPFEDAWIASWGAERRDGVVDKKSITLQVIHARLMDRQKCNNITHRFGVTVTPNFICLSQSGKRAPCTRDTGAPAVSDGVIWGLASWGIRRLCGTERFPSMFSYLASHTNMDFISNATRFLMSDERFYPSLDRYVRVQEPPFTTLAPAV